MNTHRGEDHEERLESVLAGAEEPWTGFELSELAKCDACRALVVELLATEERVQRAADRGLETWAAETRDVRPGPAESVFAEALRRSAPRRSSPARVEYASRPAPSSASRRRIWPWLAVAAAALLLLTFARPWEANGGPGPGHRGDPTLGTKLVRPVGVVDGPTFGMFEWEVARPADGYFVVEVSYRDEEGIEQVHRSERLRAQQWRPDPQLEAHWPDRIDWLLEVHDGSGAFPELHAAWARRSG